MGSIILNYKFGDVTPEPVVYPVKNGWVYFRNEAGVLMLSESFVNEFGVTYSDQSLAPPGIT